MTGDLAIATASVKETKNRYIIDVKVATKGIYNLLRGKRTEHYRSVGHIRRGIYYSDKLTIERWVPRDGFHDLQEYAIQYRHKKIVKRYKKWNKNKLIENTKKTLDHFGHNDYLTVLHNALQKYGKVSVKRITYTIAGSEETHGKIPIYISNDPKLIKRWGGPSSGTLIQMGIHKGIFKNGKGSMTVLLDTQKRPLKFYFSHLDTIGTLTGRPIK